MRKREKDPVPVPAVPIGKKHALKNMTSLLLQILAAFVRNTTAPLTLMETLLRVHPMDGKQVGS